MDEPTVRDNRLKFHSLLLKVCENVYFQPPESIQMKYPCIVYNLDDVTNVYSNNSKYLQFALYNVTYIDKIPDADAPKKLLSFPYSEYQSSYVADNLNHTVISITTKY